MSEQRQLSVSARVKDMLSKSETFAQLLPACYRGMATRFINRSALYIATSKNAQKIQACTPESIYTAVLQAAEYGLPVDGRMAHIVPYGNQATFMPDYKGLVAVGRRHAAFKDAFARVVYEGDLFHYAMKDGLWTVEHVPCDQPGNAVRVYCCVLFDDSRFTVEVMTMMEVDKIRARSKAANSGPWVTDYFEMAKKTVIRRAIKLYSDDPEMLDLIDKDDAHGIVDDFDERTVIEQVPPASRTEQAVAAISQRRTRKEPPKEVEQDPPRHEEQQRQQPEFDPNEADEQHEEKVEPTTQAHSPGWATFSGLFDKLKNAGGCDRLLTHINNDNPCGLRPDELEQAREVIAKRKAQYAAPQE